MSTFWTKEREERAYRLDKSGMPIDVIAKRIGRGPSSVRIRLAKIKARKYQAYLDSMKELEPSITFLMQRGYYVNRIDKRFLVDSQLLTPEQVILKAQEVRKRMEILVA